ALIPLILIPMLKLSLVGVLLAQAFLLSHAAPRDPLHLERFEVRESRVICTLVEPGNECFMGMCPTDRTCIAQDGIDTCCLNDHIVLQEVPSESTTTTEPTTTDEASTGTTLLPTTTAEASTDTTTEPVTTAEASTGTMTERTTTVQAPTSSAPEPTTTVRNATPSIATTGSTAELGSYCACEMDEFGLAGEWAEQLWVDIVIILDTSAAMGHSGVIETTSIIESFISRMNLNDFSTPKYSRISLITASQWPTIHFYFNMSSYSDLSYIKSEPFLEFNFVESFKAAHYLFNFYTPPELHRAQVPRVIYLITNTRPPAKIAAADQFKQDGGIIIVTDFVQEGASPQPLLESIASPGYFFYDLTLDYNWNLKAFCEVNCFCPSSTKAVSTKPSQGCFQVMTQPASFDRAVQNCKKEDMEMATIRSEEEEEYLVRVKGLPHWFGLRHDDSNGFTWTDEEGHAYSNWAVQEPELENNQNCAYVLKGTAQKIEWFTGNCHLPFYYSCRSAPCSAERYCSEEQLFRSRKMIRSV
ncbi:hypothetical protein PMAYCL1PPCAC_22424, partial [Pristionchus mayeri]